MANQIIIDIGAVANDGTGDPLRTAFNYVNNNFSNVWATGVANSNIAFSGNKILTTNTNGNLVLAPNGVGKVQANVDIVPNANNTLSLGSLTNKWNTVYTQYVEVGGEINLTGDLSVGGNLTVTGDIIEMGNIVTDAKTIQLANTAANASSANGSGITVGASDDIATVLYNSTSNVWTTNIGITATGNITGTYFIGNGSQLTGITSYANANAVAYGQAGWAGNIIPATSNTYSLGNATNQWNDLYVSNATIYMNNVPLSLTAGNVLTINGEAVLSNDSATNITTTGNITANIVTATESADLGSLRFYASSITMNDDLWDYVSIAPSGESWAYLQLPKNSVANVQDTRLHNDAGNIEFGTGDYSTGSTSYTWTLDNTGNLNVPVNINFNGGGIQQVVNEDFYTRVSDNEDDGWTLFNVVDDGAGTVFTQTKLDNSGFYVQTDVASVNHQWNFDNQGRLNLPGNLQGVYGGDTSFYAVDNGSGGMVEMKMISYIGDTLLANVTVRHPNVTISTQNSLYTWTFDGTGNLVLPASGNLVGSTPNNNGYINWLGNSSGDGGGYTTLRLVPDDTREGGDQYLIIDPTAPGHIHIRAGGTQDNSGADLFLGGENSYFKVRSGANANVEIGSNSNNWTFDTTGNLNIPKNIHGLNNGVPLVIDAGTQGYSYVSIPSFTDGGETLNIVNNYTAPTGGINLTVNSKTWNFTSDGIGVLPNSVYGYSQFYTSGAANLYLGSSSYPINIVGSNGDLIVPGAISTTGNISGGYILGNAAFMTGIPASYGNANVADFLDSLGSNAIVTTGNISGGNLIVTNATMTGNLVVNTSISSQGATDLWLLPATGTTRSYGNINPFFANTYNLGGSTTRWNNVFANVANVVTLTAVGNIDGSGATFSGNVTAANFSGNISITGNVTGTSSNVTLVAGSYSTTFDNTGNTTLANGTVTMTNLVANGTTSLGNTSTVTTSNYQIGYRDIPQLSLSANTTAALTDASKHFYSTTVGNLQVTIPDNANVAFPTGATLTVVVNAAGNVIVAQGTGVSLYMAGSSSTGNRTVGAYGLASVMKVDTDTWVISGTGVY